MADMDGGTLFCGGTPMEGNSNTGEERGGGPEASRMGTGKGLRLICG